MASQYVKLPAVSGGGGGGAVDSFNGRTGVVVSQAGDYSAGIISNTPAGNISATNVQSAINELDSEKQATITGAATTIVSANLTANRAVISNASGKIATTAVTHTELDYVGGVTSPIQTQLDGKQPLDSDLTAIAALSSNGLVTRTGAGTAAARTITAGSASVSVTNGNGVSGNPTIDLPNSGASSGSYGANDTVPSVTVNSKGIVTSISDTPIAIVSAQVTNFNTSAQSAVVQNALFPASTVKAPSVDAVTTALASVLVNPMTTDGDMIYYDNGNVRLPIGNADDILRVVNGFPSWEPENLTQDFGDGSDGDLVVSGALTLTQIPYYNTLTINPGAVINPNGYPIYCKTLDLTNAPVGAIARNGNNGANGINSATGQPGGAALSAAILGGSGAGSTGAAGQSNAGAASGAATNLANSNGGGGGASGASGAGGTGAGVAAGAGGIASNYTHLGRFEYQFLRGAAQIVGGPGGDGGNSGGGDGANSSRGAPGGGGGAAIIVIYAANIITGPSTPAGVIQCIGGNGGSQPFAPTVGNVGGASGAGGGGGGFCYLTFVKKTGPVVNNLINCSGGNGGNGGNGVGTGIGGAGGQGGTGGVIQTYNVTTGLGVQVIGTAGALGTAAVGITGGVGGNGGPCVLSL